MNTAVYYPQFYPPGAWLRLGALLWDRIYTMHLEGSTPPAPENLIELSEALGNVWTIAYPWDEEFASIPVKTKVFVEGPERWDKVLKVNVRPRRREWVIEPRKVTVTDVARSDETEQQFRRWLDLRSKRLRQQMTASSDDYGILSEMTAIRGDKFWKQGPVLQLLEDRGLLQQQHRSEDIELSTWELQEREYLEMEFEALPMEVVPESGSDHERYVQLRRQASDKRISGDGQVAEQLDEMAEQIRRRNLVAVSQDVTTYYLPKDVALYYLSLCAERLAQLGRRDVVTNQRQFADPLLESDEQLRGEVAAAVLQAYVPKDLATIEPARIADCRAQLSADRLKFQAEVQRLVRDFAGEAASVDTYEMVKAQLVEMASDRIEQTKRTYRKARLDVTAQALNLSLTPPALATAAASALHIGLLAPAGIAATLSLFTASKVIEWRNARSDRDSSPWSYVLDISKGLS
jgi:hypothetical protein